VSDGNDAKAHMHTVVTALADVLKRAGYSKSGQDFRRTISDVVHMVSVQQSQASTRSTVRFTVNLGVWVPSLASTLARAKRPSVWDAHWRRRLGYLMPERTDVWWSVTSEEEAHSAARAVSSAVVLHGLPRLAELSDALALLRIWDAGSSPGLTAAQCEQLRSKLRSTIGDGAA
jgi:hypothetical protein